MHPSIAESTEALIKGGGDTFADYEKFASGSQIIQSK